MEVRLYKGYSEFIEKSRKKIENILDLKVFEDTDFKKLTRDNLLSNLGDILYVKENLEDSERKIKEGLNYMEEVKLKISNKENLDAAQKMISEENYSRIFLKRCISFLDEKSQKYENILKEIEEEQNGR